jgi:hypothetical protein
MDWDALLPNPPWWPEPSAGRRVLRTGDRPAPPLGPRPVPELPVPVPAVLVVLGWVSVWDRPGPTPWIGDVRGALPL